MTKPSNFQKKFELQFLKKLFELKINFLPRANFHGSIRNIFLFLLGCILVQILIEIMFKVISHSSDTSIFKYHVFD